LVGREGERDYKERKEMKERERKEWNEFERERNIRGN